MSAFERLTRIFKRPDLPAEIYVSIVNSLYADAFSLFVGSISAALAALVTGIVAGDIGIYLVALSMALVAIGRAWDMVAYKRDAPGKAQADKAARWERRYTIGGIAQYTLLGVWFFIAFQTAEPLVHLIATATTIAYMIGVSGRNFGSDRLVSLQLLATGIPIATGLYLNSDRAYIVLAFFIIPFFASLRSISARLRHTLLDAVIATHEISLLAKRFDTALNNMPHGLAMFDADRRLVVANGRLGEILGLPLGETDRKGETVRELLLGCVEAGVILWAQFEGLAEELESRLDGRSTGRLQLETSDTRTLDFTFQQMENRGSVVLVEDITERRAAEARIRHLARYDALTGLPNRTFFHDQMERILAQARTQGESCALLFIDLDQFKQVNDTLGHPTGDQLLCEVADRIKEIVEPGDLVARFGGDEFVVLRTPLGDPEEAALLAGGLVARLGERYQFGGHEVVIGASIGIALAPRDGDDADHVLKNADMALYRAKADGRGAWRFFEAEMDVSARARRELELDLRDALANDVFEVFYQPLYNLRTKRISTCEALLRWPHPVRGMVSPAEFIPVAEEMGLIVELGNRVLHKACAECMNWPDDVRVAVNFSPIQFRRGNIPAIIREALAATGLPAHRLEIEITESVLFQDAQAARLALEQIREMGVRIALDDFGTGYSSLSYLHSFHLHKVKIDRSFVVGLGKSERAVTLLRGVTRLSADLGLSVAVEGIETQDQLAVVIAAGAVDEAQGFLFSKAIPARQLRKLIITPAVQLEKVA